MVRATSRFEAINASNLNFTFQIPVVDKPGRGLRFVDGLVFNSDVYTVRGGYFALANGGGFGQIFSHGNLTYSQHGETCRYYNGHSYITYSYTMYGNFVWYAPSGSAHSFGGSTSTTVPCHAGQPSLTGEDAYGYQLNLAYETQWSVTAPNGVIFGSSIGPEEDPNGNFITWSGAANVDTTGQSVETVVNSTNCVNPIDGQTYPFCTQFNVLEPASTSYETYTEFFQTFSVNSGSCPSVGAYSGSFGVPVYLTLPEYTAGSSWYYQFGWNGAGELTSVRFPTGGVTTYSYGSLCTLTDGGPSSLTITENDNNGNTGTTTLTRGPARRQSCDPISRKR